jgi:hypothetical protein
MIFFSWKDLKRKKKKRQLLIFFKKMIKMKIEGLGQTKNYIKQNHEKIKMKNLGFIFILFFSLLFYFLVLFLYNFYNFTNDIFVIKKTLILFGSL